jgi:hypothetical protein
MIAAKSKASAPVPGKLDRGIRKAVERLQACGIETFESCEGGEGHAFQEPTIRFYGTPEAGWRHTSSPTLHSQRLSQRHPLRLASTGYDHRWSVECD